MAFNPNKFSGFHTNEKALPVVLLLDVSSSMDGDRIDILYDSVSQMVEDLDKQSKKMECKFKVAIITFGDEVKLHTPYTDVKDLVGKIPRFDADGMTPLGHALELAKDMIEDKKETLSRWYRPAVVLVSDGQPNDNWQGPLQAFLNTGRSQKCQRFAVAIQADLKMLHQFATEPEFCFEAENASDISKSFQLITMSVSTRATQANPNEFAGDKKNENVSSGLSAKDKFDDDDEEDEFI